MILKGASFRRFSIFNTFVVALMINTNSIFQIRSETDFIELTFEIFKYQFENNGVYRSYCDLLYKHPASITNISEIPFLPIQFFKSHKVMTGNDSEEIQFESSGTSGQKRSIHYLSDLSLYETSFLSGFKNFYGPVEDYTILALLPSYLERKNSSLVYMADRMIQLSSYSESGFFLNDLDELASILNKLDKSGRKILLLGVSFALLDLVEKHSFDLKNTIVMETGGMKGRRKELIREELHTILRSGFGLGQIHSEYGMTELLSQAYSSGNGLFRCPAWMNVIVRDTEDPLSIVQPNTTGGINIIDLANINSCSFIATQDLGKLHEDSSFEILGRFDHSEIRGCNLMAI